MPGVSEKTIWKFSSLISPMMRCRVVCAFEEIIESRSPISTFIKVDLPTLGLPTILTKPALCVVSVMNNKFSQRYLIFPKSLLPLYSQSGKRTVSKIFLQVGNFKARKLVCIYRDQNNSERYIAGWSSW